MNRVYIYIFLLVVSIYSSKTFSEVLYEQCTWDNKQYTDHLLKDSRKFQQTLENRSEQSEAGFCDDCKQREIYTTAEGIVGARPIRNALNEVKPKGIPSICFYASMTKYKKPGRKNYYYCPSSTDENPTRTMSFACDNPKKESNCQFVQRGEAKVNHRIDPRKACLNKDYVDLTARAFNQMTDCFDLSQEEKIKIFSMFNYESSFHVNARSSTGARCYGQLTYDRFKFINKFIYYRNNLKSGRQSWAPYSQIYKDAIDKCPALENKVIPPKLLSETKTTDRRLNAIVKRANMSCGLTQDMYSCLFYSLYSTKLDTVMFDKEYQTLTRKSARGTNNIPEQLKTDFQLPISFDEALVLKGKIKNKKTGEVKNIRWVITSSAEIHRIFGKKYNYDMRDLTITKKKLFSKDDLKSYFTKVAHNGGLSQISERFEYFMKMMKRVVSNADSCRGKNDPSLDCQHRTAILNGQALTSSDLNQQFKRYVRPRNISNKNEVIKFVDRINRDVDFLNNVDPNSRTTRPLRDRLRKLLSNNKDQKVSEGNITGMIEDVGRQCSSVIRQKR